MLLHLSLLLLPSAFSQFAPLGMEPDVAFGDQNDRYDLKPIYRPIRHKLDWRRQFQPMGLVPDVAFGDQNDRFDLSALQHHNKHKFRSDDDFRRQFQPMGLKPDVAFGDQNDRFDLSALQGHNKHKFRSDDGFRRQFQPMGLVPDVAFGDQNDRFDLSALQHHNKHKFRSDDADFRRSSRRLNQPIEVLFRRSAQPQRRIPLDEDWLEDMTNIAEDAKADGTFMLNQAQNYRRHHPLQIDVPLESLTDKPDREIRQKYAPPVKIKLQDRANGSFIFNFNV